jgi:predicted DNA-binding WGR domain protein
VRATDVRHAGIDSARFDGQQVFPTPRILTEMQLRLEQINHYKRRKLFCVLTIRQTLFGEWELCRECGRIGDRGSQREALVFASRHEVEHAFEQEKHGRIRKGYAPIPEQLDLF